MASKFTTSVNIIRDSERDLNYLPTPNAIRIVEQINHDFQLGIRSFNIIGSYGTGKSSFLWAFQQTLTKRKSYFDVKLIPNGSVEYLNIVGEYRSIKETLSEYLDVKQNPEKSENILSTLYNRYYELGKDSPLLIIIIDEFGKFLEYASQNDPEKELYFLQQLAEFVNNSDSNIILLTAVHQNFDAYALGLNNYQKQEWTKVKGRFKELTFNEPVEQLLFLASEHIKEKENHFSDDHLEAISQLFTRSKAFNVDAKYLLGISAKLYPLDLFSSSVLTLCLQKYGQNERSLFSFLEATDHTGLLSYQKSNEGFYGLSEVYDYLTFNFYSSINSRYNPDFSLWMSIKSTLERIESGFVSRINEYSKIVKTIGLLSLTSNQGSLLDRDFLVKYCEICLQIIDSGTLINDLEVKKIILYRNYTSRYVLFEGTDLDFQTALIEAGNKVNEITDVTTLLKKYYQLPPIIAKEISYKTGTPRLFEYVISAYPIDHQPHGEIDGFINLIFNDKLDIESIKSHSAKQSEAILFGYYKQSATIKDLLLEIEKTKKVIEDNIDDRIAVRELNNSILHQNNFLTHKILNNFYSKKPEVIWIFRGIEIKISTKKIFNSTLSEICNEIYSRSPIFNNELVNKHKISSSIHSAKKNFFRALINNWNKPQLGFQEGKFPPERTIYMSLLENNDIHLDALGKNGIMASNEKNGFNYLWEASESFLNSAKISRKRLSEFTNILNKKPFKLKQGLIDFWIPTFLFIKRDDFALFGQAGYIPFITDDVLDLISKSPNEYEIKTFDIDGIKLDLFNSYRLILNQEEEQKLTGSNFIETIKPFLTFYRDLPDYSRNTSRLTKETLRVRGAIASSKDPEKTFFEDLPTALGFTLDKIQDSDDDLRRYVLQLRLAIKELQTCYDELVNRVEYFILTDIIGEEVPFEEYKIRIQVRFKKLRKHLLLPHQKIFVQRLDSLLDDRKAWLNSIVQSLIGMTLEKLRDEDESLIYDKFSDMILTLDSLTTISATDFLEEKEAVYDLQINSFVDGLNKKLVRLPKAKQAAASVLENNIKKSLGNDKVVNIAALTGLLKDLLK